MSDYTENRQQKLQSTMRLMYDLFFSLLIIAMGFVMFFAKQLNLEDIIDLDDLLRNLFGGICILYGVFRFYRGVIAKR
ncbi:MAG: hypothetical protein ACOVQE_00305 [Chitinophagaceae bacterium]